MSKQTDMGKEGRKDPAAVLQALRDLVHAVEMAEDNDYSEASRKLLAACKTATITPGSLAGATETEGETK